MNNQLRSLASLLPLLAIASTALAAPPVTPMTPDVVASYERGNALERTLIRREVKIPMRDGTKLYTVIMMKKGTKGRPNPAVPDSL